jgi:hypothetical protein
MAKKEEVVAQAGGVGTKSCFEKVYKVDQKLPSVLWALNRVLMSASECSSRFSSVKGKFEPRVKENA